MPLYEGISLVTEKNSVILDFGSAYTKCGFAREPSPRWIIPSIVKNQQTGMTTNIWTYWNAEDLTHYLKDFLYQIYFKYLLVNPRDRRVVVIESVLCPTVWRDTLAQVLFEHFEIPAVVFLPSHLAALYTLRVSSALVLDVGYTETVALPVFEGVCILNAWQGVPLAAHAIHRRIEVELMEAAKVTSSQAGDSPLAEVLHEPLNESVLEDIKARVCFVTTFERGQQLQEWNLSRFVPTAAEKITPPTPPKDVEYPLGGDKLLKIPGTLREFAAEVLFELDADMKSVASILLDAILKSPRDSRRHLAENILVMGGTAMLPGFKARLKRELYELMKDRQYAGRLTLPPFKFHNPPCKDNYTAWLGGSIYGSTDYVAGQAITLDAFVNNNRHVPDWSDQKWSAAAGTGL